MARALADINAVSRLLLFHESAVLLLNIIVGVCTVWERWYSVGKEDKPVLAVH